MAAPATRIANPFPDPYPDAMPATRFLALALSALLAAPATASTFDAANIVGTWEPVGGTCESDNVVIYKRDGDFDTFDTAGRWKLRGNKLETTTTEAGEPPQRVKPPERHTSTIVALSREQLTEVWQDGSLHQLRRCR